MNHKLKHIVKKAKTVSLSSQEKDEMKASLLKHVESHPLTLESGTFLIQKRVSYFEWIGANLNNKRYMVPAVFSLVIVLTTGISFASSSSLPGGFLYPVKILNEKINSVLASDPIDKVKVLTINTVNRLEEAEKLFIDGKLDEKTEVKIAEFFENDSELANRSIVALENNNKKSGTEASIKFKEDLDKHKKILSSFSSLGDVNVLSNILSNKVDIAITKLESSSTSDIESSVDGKEEDKKTENEDNKSSTDSNEGDDEDGTSINIPDANVNINAGGSGSVSVPNLGL